MDYKKYKVFFVSGNYEELPLTVREVNYIEKYMGTKAAALTIYDENRKGHIIGLMYITHILEI